MEELYEAGLIQNIADLYALTVDQLLALGKGWKEKSAQKVIDGIAASRQVPFERVLFALGIRHVGETVAKKIARAVDSMDRLMKMPREELEQVILAVCQGHYLTLQALAELLCRKPVSLRNDYLSPMVRARILILAFPTTPTHERQAYCANGTLPRASDTKS